MQVHTHTPLSCSAPQSTMSGCVYGLSVRQSILVRRPTLSVPSPPPLAPPSSFHLPYGGVCSPLTPWVPIPPLRLYAHVPKASGISMSARRNALDSRHPDILLLFLQFLYLHLQFLGGKMMIKNRRIWYEWRKMCDVCNWRGMSDESHITGAAEA